MWQWQNVGEVQTFQVSISNVGQEPPLFLSHIAAQGISVSDGASTVFMQPALDASSAGSAVYAPANSCSFIL